MKYTIPPDSAPGIPFIFRIARAWSMLFSGKRGEFFLYGKLLKLGLLNRVGRFPFFDDEILVPLTEPATRYIVDFTTFICIREVNFANSIIRALDDYILIDCGAAYGRVSMRIAHLCPNVERIIAIEPNADNCEVLTANLQRLPVKHDVINKAVSDFHGNAKLVFPHGEGSPNSAYIAPDTGGDIPVVKIDDLLAELDIDPSNRDFALKIDVEGEELKAIEGARDTIQRARAACFFVELHPEVLRRQGISGESILQGISKIRNIRWTLADRPSLEIDIHKPFFDQIGTEMPSDVIGVTT